MGWCPPSRSGATIGDVVVPTPSIDAVTHVMTSPREPADPPPDVNTDLVEYLIIVVPEVGALTSVAGALANLVDSGTVRILDLVVLVRDADGTLTAFEASAIESMAELRGSAVEMRGLLSDRDIGVSSLAIEPGTVGAVVVTEDRWARPLSVAARRAGGRIVAGDRIPAGRVEAALSDAS